MSPSAFCSRVVEVLNIAAGYQTSPFKGKGNLLNWHKMLSPQSIYTPDNHYTNKCILQVFGKARNLVLPSPGFATRPKLESDSHFGTWEGAEIHT